MGLLGLHLRAPLWVVLVVTSAFMFCGAFIGNATHTSWLYAFAFLPLMAWRLDVALNRRRLWPAAEIGALYGLSALAGHPALVTLNGLFLAAWAIGRLLFGDEDRQPDGAAAAARDRRCRASRWAHPALVLLVAAAVAAVVLAPAYLALVHEAAGFSDRVGQLSRASAITGHVLPVAALLTLASPYISFLEAGGTFLWNETFFGLTCSYVGSIAPALAMLALVARPRSVWRWWLLALGSIGLAAAVGDLLPVRGWLYDLVLPTRYFRHPAVFRVYFLFSVLVLALHGGKALARPSPELASGWARLLAISVALSCGALLAWAILASASEASGRDLAPASLQVAFAWIVVPVVVALACRRASGKTVWNARAVLVGVAVLDALASVYTGRHMMTFDREAVLRSRAKHGPPRSSLDLGAARRRSPYGTVDNLNLLAKVPQVESFNQLSNRLHTGKSLTPLPTSWSREEVLSASVLGNQGRVWFAATAPFVSPTDLCFGAFVLRARVSGAMPIVLHRRADLVHLPRRGEPGPDDHGQARIIAGLPPAIPVLAESVRATTSELELRVRAPENGWLLITDRWARSWIAEVDGVRTDVLGGNFLFRAVPVSKGTHTIRFEFRPLGHPWLVLASWGLLAVVAALSLLRAVRSARGPRAARC